jgi:hypothetical protein
MTDLDAGTASHSFIAEEILRLRAENARLREALETFAILGWPEALLAEIDRLKALLAPFEALRGESERATLQDVAPGLFATADGHIGLKTEYAMLVGRDTAGGLVEWEMTRWPEAYVAASGEVFWGGASTHEDRAALLVRPILDAVLEALRTFLSATQEGK